MEEKKWYVVNTYSGHENKVKEKFSTAESGAYTVSVFSPVDKPRPFRKLIFSYAGFEVSGPEDQTVRYLEWNFL